MFHVVSPNTACTTVDANDAACHGCVSQCVAGDLVKGRACFMFDLCGVFGILVYPSSVLLIVTVLGAVSLVS